ncbi:MAG: HNH endonuclease [Solirubrobacterales bacterium]
MLFDRLGPGPATCHYCPIQLVWGSTLEVDHLDLNRANNRIENLVPCCRKCGNRRRGGAGDVLAPALSGIDHEVRGKTPGGPRPRSDRRREVARPAHGGVQARGVRRSTPLARLRKEGAIA